MASKPLPNSSYWSSLMANSSSSCSSSSSSSDSSSSSSSAIPQTLTHSSTPLPATVSPIPDPGKVSQVSTFILMQAVFPNLKLTMSTKATAVLKKYPKMFSIHVTTDMEEVKWRLGYLMTLELAAVSYPNHGIFINDGDTLHFPLLCQSISLFLKRMSKVSVFPLPLDQYPRMSQFIGDNKSACICAQYRQDPEFASFKNGGVYPAIMRFYGSNVATLITRFKEDILPLETKNTKCRGNWFGTSETLVNAKDSAKFIKSVKSGKKDAEIDKGSPNEIPSSHPSSSAPTGSSFTQGEEKRTSSAFVPRGHGALPSIMHMVAEVDWTPTPVQTQDHLSASTQPLSRPASVLAPSPASTSISATLSDLQDPASRYQHLMASQFKTMRHGFKFRFKTIAYGFISRRPLLLTISIHLG